MTTHSAQSSEGSNMNVSTCNEEQKPEQIIKAHEGMVSGLYGHIQTNDYKENAVTGKARVECALQHKRVKPSPTSHDFTVDNSSDDDNDSYYTARNSPEREVYETGEAQGFIKMEPGEIVTPNSLEAEYEKLKKQLERNNEIEAELADEIQKHKQVLKILALQKLEVQVLQSIGSNNRRPMMNIPVDNEPLAANKSQPTNRRSKKRKQKAKLNKAIKRPYESDTESTLNIRPDVLPDVDPVSSNQFTGKTAEALISDEEKALIEPDCPPYRPLKLQNSNDLEKEAERIINKYLNHNALSLKEMKLILLNLKIASTGQVRQIKHARRAELTINQEVFVKELIKSSLSFIENYMTLTKNSYEKMMKKRDNVRRSTKYKLLPELYYGDVTTLNFQARDLSHYELYKIIKHFDSILDENIKTKAEQFLLKSGKAPPRKVHRTCNPNDT